jgi:hypothetical protein
VAIPPATQLQFVVSEAAETLTVALELYAKAEGTSHQRFGLR